MHTIFFTGFPGFIGKQLALTLLKKYPDVKLIFLVHPSQLDKAKADFKELGFSTPHEIISGDITQSNLGMSHDSAQKVKNETTIVFHLAAIYDLTVPETLAQKVNVWGTQNMLNFFSQAPNLKRFNHISTCYVSGDQKGLITPDKLEERPKENLMFHNFYESTKHASEVLVKNKMSEIPITIFRPAIVVGNSKTGLTDKFDGPYVVMKFLHQIRFLLRLVPNLGFKECEVNTVPVDYAVDVMATLAFQEKSKGQTYQICDQHPPSTEEFFGFIVQTIGGITPFQCTFLKKIILKLLRLPGVSKITGITCQHLDYFMHEGQYRSPNLTQDLEGSGITLPHYKDTYPTLYNYMKNHLH